MPNSDSIAALIQAGNAFPLWDKRRWSAKAREESAANLLQKQLDMESAADERHIKAESEAQAARDTRLSQFTSARDAALFQQVKEKMGIDAANELKKTLDMINAETAARMKLNEQTGAAAQGEMLKNKAAVDTAGNSARVAAAPTIAENLANADIGNSAVAGAVGKDRAAMAHSLAGKTVSGELADLDAKEATNRYTAANPGMRDMLHALDTMAQTGVAYDIAGMQAQAKRDTSPNTQLGLKGKNFTVPGKPGVLDLNAVRKAAADEAVPETLGRSPEVTDALKQMKAIIDAAKLRPAPVQ